MAIAVIMIFWRLETPLLRSLTAYVVRNNHLVEYRVELHTNLVITDGLRSKI